MKNPIYSHREIIAENIGCIIVLMEKEEIGRSNFGNAKTK